MSQQEEVTFGLSLQTYSGGLWDEGEVSLKELGELVQEAEKLGYTHIWHVDRLAPRPMPAYNTSYYDPIVTLSAIIPYVKNARIGTATLVVPTRNPVRLAKQLATMDVLSDGRLTIGLSMGWSDLEYQWLSVDFKKRPSMFEEGVKLISRLLSEDEVSFEGKYWKVSGVQIYPRPRQKPRPPILLGGGGPWIGIDDETRAKLEDKVMRRIAMLGDGWIIGSRHTPESALRQIQLVKKHLAELGRDPSSFMIMNQNIVFVDGVAGNMEEAKKRLQKIVAVPLDVALKVSIIGPPDEVKRRIDSMIKAGVRHFIVLPIGMDYRTVEYIAKEIAPTYQKR